MNLEKSQLKVQITNNLGADLEDRLEGERKAADELSGASAALKQAAIKVPLQLAAKIDTALAEGEIKDMGALEVAEFAKKYLAKAGDFLRHLSEVEKDKEVAQRGRVDGLTYAMETVQKMRDTETERIQVVLNAIEKDGEAPRTEASVARQAHGSAADRRAQATESKGNGTPQKKAPPKKRKKTTKKMAPKSKPALRATKKVE